jgi:hypothetical protein
VWASRFDAERHWAVEDCRGVLSTEEIVGPERSADRLDTLVAVADDAGVVDDRPAYALSCVRSAAVACGRSGACGGQS